VSTSKTSAIIFDCFGVLVSEGWLPFKQTYFGNDSEKFEQATNIQKRADAGLIHHADFLNEAAQLANIDVSQARAHIDSTVTNQILLEYIATLKPHYKIGFISNASQSWMDQFFTPEQVALFDAVDISSQTGLLKPDPRAFEHIAYALDVPAEECVLIDDQATYCDGARSIGMKAITYREFNDMKNELEAIIGKKNND